MIAGGNSNWFAIAAAAAEETTYINEPNIIPNYQSSGEWMISSQQFILSSKVK